MCRYWVGLNFNIEVFRIKVFPSVTPWVCRKLCLDRCAIAQFKNYVVTLNRDAGGMEVNNYDALSYGEHESHDSFRHRQNVFC